MCARLRHWLRVAVLIAFSICGETTSAQQADTEPSGTRPNMVGAYGPWLSDQVLGDGPARLSFRTGKWNSLDEWRRTARARVSECMAPVDLGGLPEVRVESTHEFDGLHIERLSWQLP